MRHPATSRRSGNIAGPRRGVSVEGTIQQIDRYRLFRQRFDAKREKLAGPDAEERSTGSRRSPSQFGSWRVPACNENRFFAKSSAEIVRISRVQPRGFCRKVDG